METPRLGCLSMTDPECLSSKRREALLLGVGYYFTGKPCRKGHLARRSAKKGICVECRNESFREWHARNLDRNRARGAAWREENIEKIRESQRAYEKINGEKRREKCRAYHEKNRDDLLEKKREWRKRNIERVRAYCRNRHARKAGANGSHTPLDIAELMKEQKGKCACCRKKITVKTRHVDHIIPLSKGGSNLRSNLQMLCPKCNLQKHASLPEVFFRRKGFLL